MTPGSWYTNLADVGAGPGYVTKLNSDGSDLVYSTYLPVQNVMAIAVDSANNAYFTAQGRAWKLNAAGTGPGYPAPYIVSSLGLTAKGIAVDSAGSAYVVGADATTFVATPGAFQTTKPSTTNFASAYLLKINPAGTAATYATWLGTTQSSAATAVTVDSAGNAYVTGGTDVGALPNHTGANTLFTQESVHPNDSFAFVAKVAPDGSHLDYYARLGGSYCSPTCFSGSTTARGIDLDPTTGSVWISGETGSNRVLLVRPLYSTPAVSGFSIFAAKFGPTGTTLPFSTLLGGVTNAGGANSIGIRVDSAGSVYVAGSNNQTDFPTTPGAIQVTTLVPGVRNAFVAKINENKDTTTVLAASPSVGAVGSPTTLTATITGSSPTGTVTFKDSGNSIGTGTVSGTTAQLVTSSLATGAHTFTATYAGDAHNNTSTSEPVTYQVTDPNAAPTAFTITGITDGQVLTAGGSGQFVGGQISWSATAAFGNLIANVIIFVDGQGYTSSPNQASGTGIINLQPQGVGLHTIRGTATDSNGNILYSAPIRFVVNPQSGMAPPSVSITAPANGATLTGPGTFSLQATAASPADSVTFYAGNTGIGTAGGPPFSVDWVNPAAGTYSLMAVARSSASGASRTSTPITVTVTGPPKPTVTLTSPANPSDYWTNQPIPVAATASAAGTATITKVELFDNEMIMTTKTAPPYSTTVTADSGTHVMFARATDSNGQVAESKRAVVHVSAAAAPYVVLTAPTNGQSFTNPASITLSADAGAASGATVTKVDFYDGSTIVGTATTAPYTVTWNQPPGGTHYIMAVVTDSRYQYATTPSVSIAVIRDQLTVTVDAGIDGSQVADTGILIKGTLQAPPNSAVVINGIVAEVLADGRFFCNDIPLALGANTIQITAHTEDGVTASTSVVVNRTGDPAFDLNISSQAGKADLGVEFRLTSNSNVPLDSIEYDLNGDGQTDYSATSLDDANIGATFTPGFNIATGSVKYQGNVVWTTRKAIYAWDSVQRYDLIKGVYDRAVARLNAGQIEDAMRLFTASVRDSYRQEFNAAGSSLPDQLLGMGQVVQAKVSNGLVVLTLKRMVGGTPHAGYVVLQLDYDGIWRVSSF